MNNYFKNQIRRGNCALTTKAKFFFFALFWPKRTWKIHVDLIQAELDRQHERYKYGECLSYREMYPHRFLPSRRQAL